MNRAIEYDKQHQPHEHIVVVLSIPRLGLVGHMDRGQASTTQHLSHFAIHRLNAQLKIVSVNKEIGRQPVDHQTATIGPQCPHCCPGNAKHYKVSSGEVEVKQQCNDHWQASDDLGDVLRGDGKGSLGCSFQFGDATKVEIH